MNADQDTLDVELDIPRHVLEQAWARRATQLAQPFVREEAGEWIELVLVRLGREVYGLDSRGVSEICPLEPRSVTRVPRVPEWVAGLVNLRGRIFSVVDLQRFFGLPDAESDGGKQSKPSLVLVQTPEMELAFQTGEVLAVVSLPTSRIQTTANAMQDICSEYVQGTAMLEDGSMLSIVDLPALLADKQLIVREEIT